MPSHFREPAFQPRGPATAASVALDDRKRRAAAEAELQIPGHQVEMALPADLAPQHEDRDHRDQELGRIGKA